MARHLIPVLCAAAILTACKSSPENTFPRGDVASAEVQRNNFYQGVQVTPPRSSTSSSGSPSGRTAAPKPRSTPVSTSTPIPKPTPQATPKPPVTSATPTPQASSPVKTEEPLPYGRPVPGKPGYVTSPYSPEAGYIDITGFTPGSKARDPYTNKIFRVP
jgi:hypothetical protein